MKVGVFTYVLDDGEYMAKNIDNSREQGLEPIVIDNGCSDETRAIVEALGVPVYIHRTPTFELHDLIYFGTTIMRELGMDWYILKDADEIMHTYTGITMAEFIECMDAAGFNCINFDSYSFWPTTEDDVAEPDFTKRLRYYTYFDIPYTRAVKNSPEIWLDHPHTPAGDMRMAPESMVIRHYKFLDAEQGWNKVQARRLRYDPQNVATGSHTHYRNFTDNPDCYVLQPYIYKRLFKFDGTFTKRQVWDEWRTSHV